MGRVLILLVAHRAALLVVAWVASLVVTSRSGEAVGASGAWEAVLVRIKEAAGVAWAVEGGGSSGWLEALSRPFPSMARGLSAVTGIEPSLALLLLGHALLCLFLWEVVLMVSRQRPTPEAEDTASLILLLPATIGMSLGSPFVLACYASMLFLRNALDGRWALAGMGSFLAVAADPTCLLLLPLGGLVFASEQRGVQLAVALRRAAWWVVPALVAAFLRGGAFGAAVDSFRGAALWDLWAAVTGGGWREALAVSPLGTLVSTVLLLAGTTGAVLEARDGWQRTLPLYLSAFVLLTSSLASLPFRLPIGGVALQGLTPWMIGPARFLGRASLFGLGAYEVVRWISAA